MIDILAWIIGFFLVCILLLIVAVGFTILYNIFRIFVPKTKQSYNEPKDDKQIQQDITEDSEADMLVTSDDENQILFPPEFDDRDEE